MPGHDLKLLESELRSILTETNLLLEIIHKKGYTTPREFELVLGASRGIAAQMKTLVSVSKEIIAQAR